MAKTVMEKITNAISGTGKLDLSVLKIENDEHVRGARQAEDDAVKRAHDLEAGLAQLVSDRARLDSDYTVAAGLPDEAQVREARRKFIGADETVRGRQDHIRRAQAAAVEARKAREQAEVEAEQRIAVKVRELLAVEVKAIVTAYDEVLTPSFTRCEAILDAAERVASWGSPGARRNGLCLGLGTSGKALFRARGLLTTTGEHTIGAAALEAPYVNDGSLIGQFKKACRDLGLIE